MARKKPAAAKQVITPEPEVELTLGPVKYKMATRTACCGAGVLALLGVLFGFGFFPFLFPGFANAADTKKTFDERIIIIDGIRKDMAAGFTAAQQERATIRQDTVNSQRLVLSRIVIGNLIATAMRYCDAVRAGRLGEADAYNLQLADLQAEYQTYVGTAYPLRAC